MIRTDAAAIDSLLTRGVEQVFPSKDALRARLSAGAPMRIYHGIDPTGPTLHIGHGVQLLKVREFQDLGHHIILLIGDFTAMIGDPTDKADTRKKLSREEVGRNLTDYLEQVGKILDMKKVEVRRNSEWLSILSFSELLELCSRVTFAQIIKRDMFQQRLAENKDLFLHEFLYPLMQGYDSVVLDVDMEIGGNDQMFNMLVGRDLMKSVKQKEKFVLTGKLLVDPTGKKMGKSEGNMVALSDAAKDMYGKVMSWPDTLLSLAFEICTRVPMDEVVEIMKRSPRDAKMRLAREITTIYHGAAGADEGERYFVKTIQQKEIPEEIQEARVEKGTLLSDVLLANRLVSSKGDFKRLVEEGAIMLGEEKVSDYNCSVAKGAVARVGKRKFLKINIV